MDRICPLLGLQGEARSVIDGVDGGHRCHAEVPATALDRQQQARVCLTDAHERCERFLGYVGRHDGVRPGRSGIGGGLVTTRMILAPEPAWRGIAGKARQARSGPIAAIGAAAAILGVGGVALATGVLDPEAGVTESPLAASTPSTTPTVRTGPTPSPTPTAAPTPVPTPAPTPTPVATPPPTPEATAPPPPAQRTYTVQQGDTLSLIAQRFGTTAAAIQNANGIQDPNQIFIGQVLVIP